MRQRAWWLGLCAAAAAAVALLAGASCDDDDGDNGTGGSGQTYLTGEPCTLNDECIGQICLTDESFEALTEDSAEIPDGYCSGFICNPNSADEANCGPGAFCYDLEPYTDAPFTACLRTCNTVADCRDGYECTGAEGSDDYPPLPHKACLPPDLLCLLDLPHPSCSGTGGSGGTGGGGGAGGSTGGAGGSTGGAGGGA